MNLASFRQLRRHAHFLIVPACGIFTARQIAALPKIGTDAAVDMTSTKIAFAEMPRLNCQWLTRTFSIYQVRNLIRGQRFQD